MNDKLNFAMYWGASCGGCEIAVLEIKEKILDVAELVNIVFWPVAVDFKYKDVEAMPDGHIDLCLFNGGIRNSENAEIAQLLRRKSKVLCAFGACACWGGIPSLANVSDRNGVFRTVYLESPSTENPSGTLPRAVTTAKGGDLELPAFHNTLVPLGDVVNVDYFIPGCAPSGEQIWAVLEAVVTGQLPEPGSVVGALDKTCCDECERVRDEERKVKQFFRPHEIIPEPEKCLLEQGIICMGPATRGGCGEARCVQANMPCRGCYGPALGVADQGAKMLAAVASIIDSEDPEEVDRIIAQVADPMGTFYRFGLASSLLKRARMAEDQQASTEMEEAAG
ncbi:MAG: oxidoreductase [Armatimonadota bacterium]